MTSQNAGSMLNAIHSAAQPIRGLSQDYDGLLRQTQGRRFVLLGEASHGSHEFYRERMRITQRLLQEQQFDAVAVEADWPDALRVDRYLRAAGPEAVSVNGDGVDNDADQALKGFERFPHWMWRNRDVLNFVEWLYRFNRASGSEHHRVGFYGLDLYSLFSSIDQTLLYLRQVDPAAAQRALGRYACFDHCHRDSQRYAQEAAFGAALSCEDAVVAQLRDLRELALEKFGGALLIDRESFYAEQNARVVKNAEAYYRTMYRGDISSWNLRDLHMADTLNELALWLEARNGSPAKIVVWEHNSHVGDARATEMGRYGEWTLGQLVREKYPNETLLVGFSTYSGSVTAASDWGGVAVRKTVRPALADSYEAIFHEVGVPQFLLPLTASQTNSETDSKTRRATDNVADELSNQRLERAIGVIYRPETERHSHYLLSVLPAQFDAIIHIDKTRAVEPLELTSHWIDGEAPETFPVGV